MHEAALARIGASHEELLRAARALVGPERNAVANMANLASLLFTSLDRVNWLGFYLLRGEELVVGPFQGKPACVRIRPGRGVCGAAIATMQTLVVDDVHLFEGHIACDAASRSEIVVPFAAGAASGLLDVDSPVPCRFGTAERTLFEECVRLLAEVSDPGTF
jgi:L-methionine (R)-S-oxide reductase